MTAVAPPPVEELIPEPVARASVASTLKSSWRRFAQNKGAVAGLVILAVFTIFAIAPQVFATYDPTKPDFNSILKPPTLGHYFGTDNLGRDIFSRVVWGSRVSLEVGIASGMIMLVVGMLIGILGGYFGGTSDKAATTVTDFTLMIPIIPLILVIIALFGGTLLNVVLIIGLVGWPQVTRVLRAETLSLKKRDFIDAAKTGGVGNLRIILTHIIPNEAPMILVNAALGISFGILAEAAIDFLGLGSVQVSWGFMLFSSLDYWLSGSWWLTFFPGMSIFLASICFYLLSEGLSDMYAASSSSSEDL